MADLKGRVALVTGGGTGIGKGIALRFAQAGMKVALAGLEHAPSAGNQYETTHIGGFTAAQAAAAEIGGDALAIEADVADGAAVDAMFAQTVEHFGRIDVVVNAAGVVVSRAIADIGEADWDYTMGVNARGTFLVNKAAVIRMRAQGTGGRIINIASIAGRAGYQNLTDYCASKFAVVGFTNALAKEVAREDITVNCICPGIVGTQMWSHLTRTQLEPGETPDEAFSRIIEGFVPQGVPQTAEDMAALALYLVEAPHVTGQAINVDGGVIL